MQHNLNRRGKANLLIAGLLIVLLTTCRSQDDVLPGVARIQLVVAQNKQPLPIYFLDDTAHNQLKLEVYYYDANNVFVTPTLTPQFLVNGQPIGGNSYTFEQAGQFTFTAKVGNRLSDNQITVSAGLAAETIDYFIINTAVPFVNADSVSHLPLTYEIVDKQGRSLNPLDYAPIKLSVDGKASADITSFSTQQAGEHSLQASFLGKGSYPLKITARKPLTYDLVRLPVVMHILKSADAAKINPTAILAEVNRAYRRNKRSTDPNQADAYIEFIPATTDPDGRMLAVAGLDPLSVDNPSSVDTAAALVRRIVRRWCPQQYINVFVSLDWLRQYGPGISYSYLPYGLVNSSVTCEDIKKITWNDYEMPAIYIYDQYSFASLDHELGHFLGLTHTFNSDCSRQNLLADVPRHLESRSDTKGLKYTCIGLPFVSQYVMDHYAPHNSFTYEQVQVMRQSLKWTSYVPLLPSLRNGRRSVGLPGGLEKGSIISCGGQAQPKSGG